MESSEGTLLPPIKGTGSAPIPPARPWRPRSARTAPSPSGKIKWDPYESTTKHDFVFNPATELNADCAGAGTGHVIPFQVNEPTGRNTYQDEFYWKPFSKAEPIRCESISRGRRNNPQSGERFLFWRMPQEETPLSTDSISPWTKPISIQDVEETIKKQYRTVYTEDYLGIQPVPSVSFVQIRNQEKAKHLSTYQNDFGKEYQDIVSVLNSLDPEEVKAYVERAPNPEKIILQNFLDKVNWNKKAERPSSSKKPRDHS
ncbi:testis-expressed protein 26 isoform X2 [Sphaerodactylus townsendi]|uniref:testis-expressed protein 26 isoform X2 n=1 Tax=Sphaerodactylus townsendi TaxID=933632 RepID=UPI0020276680|nr:testis-expressed protein 26 isoform X2 [Sphaerodactylus townsendi]